MKVTTRGRKIDFTFEGMAPEAAMLTFDLDRVHSSLHERAELHGWEQRIRDNAAISRKQKDGSVITVTEVMRRDAVKEMLDHYMGGSADWNLKASARAAPQNATILAIATKRGCSYAEAEAYIAEKMLAELSE